MPERGLVNGRIDGKNPMEVERAVRELAAAIDTLNTLIAGGGGGGGTVTSVGLVLPTGVFDVSGSPVTGAGSITATFDNQAANTVFAGPDGSSGTPTFRALVAADIPAGIGGLDHPNVMRRGVYGGPF
jgi:hypothetical protein